MQRFGRTVSVTVAALTLYGCRCRPDQQHVCDGVDEKGVEEAAAGPSTEHATESTTEKATTPPATATFAEGSAKAYGMEKGMCCCAEADRITSKEECHTALEDVMAEMLALGQEKEEEKMDTVSKEGEFDDIPPGCSFKVWPDGKTGRGNWNTASSGKAEKDHIPICQEHFSRLFDDTMPHERAGGLTMVLTLGLSSFLLLGVLGVVVAVRRRVAWREIEMEDLPDVKLMPEDDDLPDGI